MYGRPYKGSPHTPEDGGPHPRGAPVSQPLHSYLHYACFLVLGCVGSPRRSRVSLSSLRSILGTLPPKWLSRACLVLSSLLPAHADQYIVSKHTPENMQEIDVPRRFVSMIIMLVPPRPRPHLSPSGLQPPLPPPLPYTMPNFKTELNPSTPILV